MFNSTFPPVDTRRDLGVSPYNPLSECCSCCYCDDEGVRIDAQEQEPELRGLFNISLSEKHRLRGGGEEEEDPEDHPALKTGSNKRVEREPSPVELKCSITTLSNPPSSLTAVTAWYNKQQSGSQRSVSKVKIVWHVYSQ